MLDLIKAVKDARPIRVATDIVPMMIEIKLEPVKQAVDLIVIKRASNLLYNLEKCLVSIIAKPR